MITSIKGMSADAIMLVGVLTFVAVGGAILYAASLIFHPLKGLRGQTYSFQFLVLGGGVPAGGRAM